MRDQPFAVRMAAARVIGDFLPVAYAMIEQYGTPAMPPPDLTIGTDYLERWWLARIEDQHNEERDGPIPDRVQRTKDFNCFLHRASGSDPQDMHDHPWPNISLILRGHYIEHTPVGALKRIPGENVYRHATDLHRLEVPDGPVWSLFLTMRNVRRWGFHLEETGEWVERDAYYRRFPERRFSKV